MSKGHVTAAMDKDHSDKMDSLVHDKQAYEALKHDPALALHLTLKGQRLLTFKFITDSGAAYPLRNTGISEAATSNSDIGPESDGISNMHQEGLLVQELVFVSGSQLCR